MSLLCTDIEGSTRLLQTLGERYAQVLTEHRRLLRAAFAEQRGCEVDTQGDAFFYAFPRALDAVAGASLKDEPERAARVLGCAEALFIEYRMHTEGWLSDMNAQILDSLRSSLDEERLEATRGEGSALTSRRRPAQ